MTCRAIPDAVAAVITAVLVDHQGVTPEQLGQLVVEQLREDGWRITAPRTAMTAVPASRHGAASEAA